MTIERVTAESAVAPVAPRRRRRVQDSVHGTVSFHGQQTVLLDLLRTRELARLRDVKQLGLANLVYPSAEHSRFSHSLGAAHLAIRYCEHLREVGSGYLPDVLLPTEEQVRDLAIAALCHDIGHGPFSHAWERDVLTERFDREPWIKALDLEAQRDSLKDARWHEIVTVGLLLWEEGELHRRLEELEPGTSQRVADILVGNAWPAFARQLIDSDVDVDRGDYLIRDSLMTGLRYGNIDIDRLIDCSYIAETSTGQLVIAFDEWRARGAVSDFLHGRAQLYEAVYFHKTIRAAEATMGLLMRRLAVAPINRVYASNVGPLSRTVLKILSGVDLGPVGLMHLHDRSVWTLVEEIALLDAYDVTAQDLARRLLSRELLHVTDVAPERLHSALRQPDFHSAIRDVIRPYVIGDASFYYVVDDARTVTIGGRELGGYFLTRSGRVVPFAEDSALRQSIPEEVTVEDRLFVPREAVRQVEAAIRSMQ